MLKIRLTRRGKKNKAFFRLVVAEHTSPIKGRFVESLGFLNPHTKEKKFEEERIKYWIGKGAQCSDSVHNMLVGAAIVKGPKRAIKMKKVEKVEPEMKPEDAKNEALPVEEKKGEAKEEKKEEPKEEVKAEKTEEKIEEKKDEKKPEDTEDDKQKTAEKKEEK